jgi:hypothetical protein
MVGYGVDPESQPFTLFEIILSMSEHCVEIMLELLR